MKKLFLLMILIMPAMWAYGQTASCKMIDVGYPGAPIQVNYQITYVTQNGIQIFMVPECCSAHCANTVWVNGEFVLTGVTTYPNQLHLFDLPQGFEPMFGVNVPIVFLSQGALSWLAWINVRTNGEVWFMKPTNFLTGDHFKFTVSFPSQ